jgi:hypothetical protein
MLGDHASGVLPGYFNMNPGVSLLLSSSFGPQLLPWILDIVRSHIFIWLLGEPIWSSHGPQEPVTWRPCHRHLAVTAPYSLPWPLDIVMS